MVLMWRRGLWWWWSVVVVLVWWCGGGGGGEGGVEALRCYKCNNCIKYEQSQSMGCGPEDTHCMKLHMETGQVQRRCGTESMCENTAQELKTRYTDVHCCTDDNCNSAPTVHPGSLLPLLLLFSAAARFLLVHC